MGHYFLDTKYIKSSWRRFLPGEKIRHTAIWLELLPLRTLTVVCFRCFYREKETDLFSKICLISFAAKSIPSPPPFFIPDHIDLVQDLIFSREISCENSRDESPIFPSRIRIWLSWKKIGSGSLLFHPKYHVKILAPDPTFIRNVKKIFIF